MTQEGISFGRYELLERIGRGGMAEIYRARLRGPGGFEKILAIKRLLPFWSSNSEFADMLVDEARVLTHLFHPNIVNVHELGVEGNELYIAMEYVHGKNLKEYLALCKSIEAPMPLAIALYVVGEILKGLDYAHTRRNRQGDPLIIVHRDISPQNILISTEGVVKITDFGIAKALDRSVEQTQTGVLKGKFAYMSPEQSQGKEIDGRSDLFTVGLILFECLVSERYFRGKTDLQILEEVRTHAIENVMDRLPLLPAGIVEMLSRALAYDPDARYGTAAEFLQTVEKELAACRENGADSDPSLYFTTLFNDGEDAQAGNDPTHVRMPTSRTLMIPGEAFENPLLVNEPTLIGVDAMPSEAWMAVPLPSKRRWPWISATIGILILGSGIGYWWMFDSQSMWFFRHSRVGGNPGFQEVVDPRFRGDDNFGGSRAIPQLEKNERPTDQIIAFSAVPAVLPSADGTVVEIASPPVEMGPPSPQPSQIPAAVVADNPPVPKPAVTIGELRVNAAPWGVVAIAGVAQGLETPVVKKIPVGTYPITVEYQGKRLQTTASVKAGRSTLCKASFSSEKRGISCR